MSRIGKKPIVIPNGVEVKQDGSVLVFKKGNVTKELDTKNNVNVSIKDGQVEFSPKGEDRQSRAYWGTYRALANNIVVGITEGFTRVLEINGVGYKAAVKGKIVELNLGFSHPINHELPAGVEASVDHVCQRLDAFVALLPDESQTRSEESAIESDDCAFVRNGGAKHLAS